LNSAEFLEKVKKREYDIVLFGQNFSRNLDSFSVWHSAESGKLNFSNLTNQDVDFLVDEIRFSGAKSDVFALNQKLDEIRPALALGTPLHQIFVGKTLLGFAENFGKFRSSADRFFRAEKWHFFQKQDWNLPKNSSKIWEFLKWIFQK